MGTFFDIRQSKFYGILTQLIPYLAYPEMDEVTASINADLTPPLNATASNPASLIVNIGGTIVSNPVSNRQKSAVFVNNIIPFIVSGTVTFPSTSGGTITTSTGQTAILACPSGDYVQVLLSIDYTSNLQVQVGTPAATAAAAVVPAPTVNFLPYAYVTIFNNSGTIANVTQSTIFQFFSEVPASSASSGGSSTGWVAKEQVLISGSTSTNVTFTTPQTDLSYVVLPMMENLTDATPEHQSIEITNKTLSGFTAKWSHPLDSGNYVMSYIVPPKTATYSENTIGSGVSSVAITNPIFQPGSIYPALTVLQNLVDVLPQFQPAIISGQSSATTTVKWDHPTDTANYMAVLMLNASAQQTVSSGVTSAVINLPVNYGSTSYGIFVGFSNVVDANPQFQPVLITNKTDGSITVSWSQPTDSANYVLTAYAISITI